MATNSSAPLPVQQPSQEPAPLSEGQRLVNTFFAPSKAFTDLRRNASWWAPFLIIAVVSLLFIYVVDQKVGFQKVAENQIQLQPKQAERLDITCISKVKRSTAFAVVLGWFAVVVLARVAIAAATS